MKQMAEYRAEIFLDQAEVAIMDPGTFDMQVGLFVPADRTRLPVIESGKVERSNTS